jgi:hypothetical protein
MTCPYCESAASVERPDRTALWATAVFAAGPAGVASMHALAHPLSASTIPPMASHWWSCGGCATS